jgi:hypothetical protein
MSMSMSIGASATTDVPVVLLNHTDSDSKMPNFQVMVGLG